MSKKTMEISCYVVGAGAFGVFFRWLQDQIAFDEAGLAEKSAFNVIVPLMFVLMVILYIRFIDKMRNGRFVLADGFCEALRNDGKAYTIARWAIGAIMCAGSAYLLISSEADKLAVFYKVTAILGLLTGICYPLLLTAANKPSVLNYKLVCTCSTVPIIFFASWLITVYKLNAINSVVWQYVVEIITVIICMIAFFRMAGFAFCAPNAWRSMFFCMLGASMCIVAMADERYMAMQIMLLASALMLLFYNWIMLSNLQKREPKPKVYPDDGFERL